MIDFKGILIRHGGMLLFILATGFFVYTPAPKSAYQNSDRGGTVVEQLEFVGSFTGDESAGLAERALVGAYHQSARLSRNLHVVLNAEYQRVANIVSLAIPSLKPSEETVSFGRVPRDSELEYRFLGICVFLFLVLSGFVAMHVLGSNRLKRDLIVWQFVCVGIMLLLLAELISFSPISMILNLPLCVGPGLCFYEAREMKDLKYLF
ncbi:hypothetical protein [Pelagicoccus sp. SDUM812003]|uniref:hypothetical protein n=1 Tax=Pelagicoccus sp. SDUM812003 TaxID=3041267 RepID=UPI00280E2DB1|nr:hypothetical protein [Pelagicoccus sp. SDUM812003]MDQ8202738.1 hypothetical protein [Pelagicoccus sp. SDUM812003]